MEVKEIGFSLIGNVKGIRLFIPPKNLVGFQLLCKWSHNMGKWSHNMYFHDQNSIQAMLVSRLGNI